MFILFIVSIIALIFWANDMRTNDCAQNTEYIALLYTHHFLFVFSLMGFLSKVPAVRLVSLLLPIIVGVHWATNDNNCVCDQVSSRICGYKKGFNHAFRQLGVNDSVYKIIMIIGIVLNLAYFYPYYKDIVPKLARKFLEVPTKTALRK